MNKDTAITCLFLDSGGGLLTNGWDHHACCCERGEYGRRKELISYPIVRRGGLRVLTR